MPSPLKRERIDLRVAREVKADLERAAELSGEKLSNFTLNAAHEKAKRIIKEREIVTLNNEEKERFLKLLENPPQASDKLKKAMKKYLKNK